MVRLASLVPPPRANLSVDTPTDFPGRETSWTPNQALDARP